MKKGKKTVISSPDTISLNNEKLLPIKKIPEVPLPKRVVKSLKVVNKILCQSLKNKPIDLNSGYIPFEIEKLKYPDNVNFLLFGWITESNDIFQNLNLVLDDINILAEHPKHYKGNSTVRLNLLLRTFFYELFRIREVFTVFLNNLKKFNFIDGKEVLNLKYAFGQRFDTAIKVRNKMVHEYFYWPSKNMTEMIMIDGLKEFGVIGVKNDLGKISTMEDKIKDIHNEFIPVLVVEGHYISGFVSDCAKNLSLSIKKIDIKKQSKVNVGK
jgi:hypothetical protein